MVLDCPEPANPQQVHLDVMVEDVDAVASRVLAITRPYGNGDPTTPAQL
jgi:hypothetical protein